MMKSKTLVIAFALAAVPASVSAKTYDIANGFSTGPFTYGSGASPATFTPYSQNYAGGCFGEASLACKTDGGTYGVPSAIYNTSATPVTFVDTVTLPGNALMVHPGTNVDAFVRFTAPATSTYTFNGAFTQYDNTNNGNGTVDTVRANGATLFSFTSSGKTFNVPVGFNGSVQLQKGDFLDFGVNNNGSYFYDSTGVSGIISYVPEPAVWTMMILGFGAVGATMRRRKAATGAAFA